MRLVVLVPFVPSVDAVEVSGLSWAILVFPVVRSRSGNAFFDVEELLFLVQLAFGLRTVQRFGKICVAGCLDILLLGRGLDSLGNKPSTCNTAALLQLR